MIFLFAVYFVFIMTLLITFLLSKRSYEKPFIKYIPAFILFILAFISSIIFVCNNGMGELMIAIFLGVTAIANGLLLLALKVVRVIVAKGK
ncbi:sugar ABC transporter ATPase [Bacillus toyonensis]|uniref:Sugar ABC transporter ATPase n=1 Tax=Bacillus toyonensis TaxID=155322 RepID=A0A2B5XUI7_9BACI|nr:sugar ABC transporter ATPase [Bacillus toyonensis]PGB00034.1 sugar ABC transporter ATPase [Bacillus toyonensis]PHD61164.1 sugar ABC transporter ATPase [Bacillus toyonensis]